MAEIVYMPKLSDTMTEGVVSDWNKKVGDKVSSGELLAEIETDKATMEFESFYDGTLLYIGVQKGEAAPINSILAIIGKEGEDISKLLASDSAPKDESKEKTESEEETPVSKSEPVKETNVANDTSKSTPASTTPAVTASTSTDERVFASPLARKVAEEKGIDISNVIGSGESGRVVKRDIDRFVPFDAPTRPQGFSTVASGVESYTEEPISQMRKVIARRLAESKFSAPHFYLTLDIDMDNAIEARNALNATEGVKISFNDLVIKAAAISLKQHPAVNSSWLEDKIRRNEHVHIGVAVAVDEGLLVPVVRFADTKGLVQIGYEVRDFAMKAKDKKLQPSDWEGNTFTISNLGMFGIESFTAIINPPDSCILAVGGIKQVPVVKKGQVVPGNVMKVTLSCDHRVVDGASGSAFLQTFKSYLENPVTLLL